MKKIISLLIAITMICTLATVAFAEDGYTIKIESQTTGHSYEAYQVFTGNLDGDVLTDITWGAGVDGTALLAELNKVAAYASCTSAADVAEVLKEFGDNSAEIDAFAAIAAKHLSTTFAASTASDTTYTIEVSAPGYYLVKDQDGSLAGEWDAYTKFILKVVKDVEVTAKMDIPALDKWVWNDDKVGGADWDDYSDYGISDTVPFKLLGTLPENLLDYSKYTYIFHDTLSAGLDFDEGSVVVTLDTLDGTNITEFFTVTEENGKLTIAADDLLQIEGINKDNDIVVYYTATLDTDAIIGNPGNPNEVYLEYANNPNWVGSGEGGDQPGGDQPGGDQPGGDQPGGDTPPTGQTPEVEVLVFTFELDVEKIDAESKEALEGAEFALYDAEGNYVVLNEDLTIAGWTEDKTQATTMISDENGCFKVVGIEPGTYYLEETKAPEGYNKLAEAIKIVIKAEYAENAEGLEQVTSLTISVNDGEPVESSHANKDIVDMQVENKSGAVLPSTGGIGTTIFYVLGGLLLVGTAVLLVTKKRLGAE